MPETLQQLDTFCDQMRRMGMDSFDSGVAAGLTIAINCAEQCGAFVTARELKLLLAHFRLAHPTTLFKKDDHAPDPTR